MDSDSSRSAPRDFPFTSGRSRELVNPCCDTQYHTNHTRHVTSLHHAAFKASRSDTLKNCTTLQSSAAVALKGLEPKVTSRHLISATSHRQADLVDLGNTSTSQSIPPGAHSNWRLTCHRHITHHMHYADPVDQRYYTAVMCDITAPLDTDRTSICS